MCGLVVLYIDYLKNTNSQANELWHILSRNNKKKDTCWFHQESHQKTLEKYQESDKPIVADTNFLKF